MVILSNLLIAYGGMFATAESYQRLPLRPIRQMAYRRWATLPHAWHRYTQDLAAPLAQILQTTQLTTTKRYLYSLDRLAVQTGNALAWYMGAGLGSMRL